MKASADGLKNLFALIIGNFGGKLAGLVNRADDREILVISAAGFKVVLTKARRNMNNTGTVFGGYKLAGKDPESAFFFQVVEIREHRLISHADKIGAFHRADPGSVFQLFFIAAEQRLRQNIFLPVFFHNRIINVFADGQHEVGRQRPGRGGPDQHFHTVFKREHNGYGIVGLVLIALIDLEVGQRGFGSPGIRQDAVVLINKPFFPELFEVVDDAFHKRQIHGLVIVTEIHPAADALKHLDPDAGIFENVRAAEIVKLFDAVFLNLFAAGNAKLLFGRHFGRQTVAVPPQTPLDLFAVHRLITGDNVFNVRNHNMSVVRRTVGKRRAVVKNEFGGTVAVVNGFFKSFVFVPELEDFFLDFDKVGLGLNFLIMFSHQ